MWRRSATIAVWPDKNKNKDKNEDLDVNEDKNGDKNIDDKQKWRWK